MTTTRAGRLDGKVVLVTGAARGLGREYCRAAAAEGARVDGAERHWERNWQLTIDTVIQEDFAAMAGVQRGLRSGAIDAIRIGANEPALGMFHASLHDALQDHAGTVGV